MRKKQKKGFTIVELVVVIAVIAILAAVLIPTFVNLIHKAEFSNDQALVRNINTTLAISAEGKDGKPTMYQTLEDVKEGGFVVENLTPRSNGSDIVWDEEHNQFVLVYENGTKFFTGTQWDKDLNTKKMWKIYTTMPASSNYSVYLAGTTYNQAVTVSGVGFDAGNNTKIPSVTYTNTGAAQNVTIRTNGGELVVNAPSDTVNHYGDADSVNIVSVASESYHENGTVPFIQISKGRIELEATADVNGIHVANVQTYNAETKEFDKTANEFTNDVVLTLNGSEVKLTRDTIGTDIESAVLVCEVQTGSSTSASEYIWLVGDGTIENAKVYVTSTSTTPNTNVASTTTKENASVAAIAIANNATPIMGTDPVTGDPVVTGYTAVEGGTSAEEAENASALKGTGTEADPFLVYDYETVQMISNFYDLGYYYFAVDLAKTDNGRIDLHNNKYISLNGSFDGKGVVFTHVNGGMFGDAGTYNPDDSKPVVLKNFTVQNEGGWGIVQGCGATTLEFNNINVTGYSLHNWNAGEFLRYGSGEGFDYTVNFVNCSCNAEIY